MSIADYFRQPSPYASGVVDPLAVVDPTVTEGSGSPSWADRAKIGATNLNTAWKDMSSVGKLGLGIGTATDLMGMWNAYNQTKLAKSNSKFQRNMMEKEHQNTVNSYNSRISDRQNARHLRDPNAHQSVSSYMEKFGAK